MYQGMSDGRGEKNEKRKMKGNEPNRKRVGGTEMVGTLVLGQWRIDFCVLCCRMRMNECFRLNPTPKIWNASGSRGTLGSRLVDNNYS